MAGPYGSTVPAVRQLALDVAAEGARPNSRAPRVADATIDRWLIEGGAQVTGQIADYRRLPVVGDDATQLTQPVVEDAARGLIELYAASLLTDVTHPERARGSGGYGAVLYTRFTDGLARLRAAVAEAVGGNTEPGGGPVSTGGTPAAVFPPSPGWASRGF